MSVPKTLVNCLSIKSGGGRAHIGNLVPRLAARFQEVQENRFSLLVDQTQAAEFAGIAGCEPIVVEQPSLGGLKRVGWERRHLGRIVQDHSIDVVFTPNQVLSAKTRARNVVLVGNMEPFLFHRYRYALKPWLRNKLLLRATVATVRKADRVIACSRFVKRHLVALPGVAEDRIFHVYHGRDTDFAAAGNPGDVTLPDSRPFFLTCGSLLPYRRCEDVLRAFEAFCQAHPDDSHVLYVAGTGTDPRYRALLNSIVDRSRVRERIFFLGHVDRAVMSHLYAHCDACILATEIEACPITAIEALTCGCRIVSATLPPMPEMLEDAARFFTPREIDEQAQAIADVLQSPLRESLPGLATRRSKAFDWDVCAEETWRVLTEW